MDVFGHRSGIPRTDIPADYLHFPATAKLKVSRTPGWRGKNIRLRQVTCTWAEWRLPTCRRSKGHDLTKVSGWGAGNPGSTLYLFSRGPPMAWKRGSTVTQAASLAIMCNAALAHTGLNAEGWRALEHGNPSHRSISRRAGARSLIRWLERQIPPTICQHHAWQHVSHGKA